MPEEIRIPKHKMLMFATLFPFIEPTFFTIIGPVHTLYKGMLVACVLYLTLCYFANKMMPSVVTILFGSLMLEMFIACKLSAGSIGSTANMYLPYMGIVMWFDLNCRKNLRDMLDVIQFLFDIYVIIDFITLIVYPNGMFTRNTYYVCWFLGHKNVQTRFIIQYMAISSVRDYIYHKKLQKITYVRIVLVLLAVLRLESKTGLVGTVAYISLVVLFLSNKYESIKVWLLKLLNIRLMFIVSAVMSVLFIVFHFQNAFSFIIVDILHKSLTLTGRVTIWDMTMEAVKNNWLLGYGVIPVAKSVEIAGASHAHNYFLNTLFNSGFVGMGIITSIWFYAGFKVKKYMGNQSIRLLMFMAVMFVVMGIAESLTYTALLYPVLLLLERSNLVDEACNEVEEEKKKAEPITKGKVKKVENISA